MGSTVELRQPGPIGQVGFDSYTIIVLGFRVANNEREKATAALYAASLKLAEAYPWLAGQVIIEGRTSTKSGQYKIVPYAEHEGKSLVHVKDCTSKCPSYDEILAAKGPFSMLDGDVLTSLAPMGYNMPRTVPWPVLVIEANYIDGGLLLTFQMQHNAADMTGQGRIITYFAQALRNEPFNPNDVLEGNRTPDIPLITSLETMHPLKCLIRASQLAIQYPTPVPPRAAMPWVYYRFSASSAASLKKLAKAYSTNDAITAFVAQRHTDARAAAELIPKDEPVVLQRAMSIRKACGYPENYLGATAGSPHNWIRPGDSLESIAAATRESLNIIDSHYARSFATALQTWDDSTTLFYGSEHRVGRDLVVSSWAKLMVAKTDFGPALGGYPGFVRRPNLPPAPGICYFMPITREGDVDVAICNTPGDHEVLREDKLWGKYAEYIG